MLHFGLDQHTQLQHVDFWSRKYPLPPAFGQKCKNRPAASGTRALFEVCVWGINAHLLQPTDGLTLLHRLNNFQDGNSYRQASRSYPRRMRRPQAWNGMVPRRPIAQGQMPIGRFGIHFDLIDERLLNPAAPETWTIHRESTAS